MIAKNNRRGANAVERYLKEKGWQVVHRESRPGRTRQLFGVDGLNLGRQAAVYVQSKFPDGLYRHQIHALESLFTGQHTCLATGTASGKSAVFYCAALDLLQRQPGSKILAMYPMKALAREQEDGGRPPLPLHVFPHPWSNGSTATYRQLPGQIAGRSHDTGYP